MDCEKRLLNGSCEVINATFLTNYLFIENFNAGRIEDEIKAPTLQLIALKAFPRPDHVRVKAEYLRAQTNGELHFTGT